MRAVLQSAFTVTTGLGNLLVVLVEATLNKYLVRVSTCSTPYVIDKILTLQFFQWQLAFLFAGLMFVDMLLLAWMASRYTYVDYTKKEKK